jgi:hypothetical protein
MPSPNLIPLELDNGVTVYVEAKPTTKDEDVSFDVSKFSEFASALAGVASGIAASFERVKPDKLAVEFGCEVGYESGKLTAILVKGAGKANFKVSLEWGASSS